MSEKSYRELNQRTQNTHATASRLILLVMVVIAVLVFIIRNIGVSTNILLVLLGFGAVILFMSLGTLSSQNCAG